MPTAEHPRLRPFLDWNPDPEVPGTFVLWDRLGVSGAGVRLSAVELLCLELLDGTNAPRDLQAAVMRRAGQRLVPLGLVTRLVEKLDDALFLEGPRFRRAVDAPLREPRHVGCYAAEPDALRRQLDGYFTAPDGPGRPARRTPDGSLRAALIPHIDYARGGVSYAWGYKDVFERTDAALFVIVGTSHYSTHRFTLTRKDYATPLGVVRTDQDFIDRIERHYGDGLFDDELLAHLPEHSIELEVVFLQYLYENVRPIRIVPLVVGSFGDCMLLGNKPTQRPDIARMIEALRRAEAETKEPVCWIISGDLAHIGPKFDDPRAVDQGQLTRSQARDQLILKQAETADPQRFYQVIADEGDARRICGLPPTFTVLEALRPARGQVLHYDQYAHPRGYESVSFASVSFDR
jgi:AmmeMemoRadiSam system protein B